jgi:hypothetical protein
VSKTFLLTAVPFGFGPVSKAVAIARYINEEMDNIKWVLAGYDSSLEFMRREFPNAQTVTLRPEDNWEDVVDALPQKIDGAIVVMDAPRANQLAERMPVFFADSLGFMQRKGSVCPNGKVTRHYVQNIFNAFNIVRQDMKSDNLVSVAPIIDTSQIVDTPQRGHTVIQLGGLLNPFNRKTTDVYIAGIKKIISKLSLKHPLILTSKHAQTTCPDLSEAFVTVAAKHKEGLGYMRGSEFTFTAPGLTAMLEIAHLQIPSAPMPPQNYSQVLNLKGVVDHHGQEGLHPIWDFLAFEYASIKSGMTTLEGVSQVTELNSEKLQGSRFISEFAKLAKDAQTKKAALPRSLQFTENGAKMIANDINTFYKRLECNR